MSVKTNDFLLQYYMQLRFNHMPAEVRAKFNEYAKNDDFRGHMKDWKKNLMTNGANNPMPDPNEAGGAWELSNDEWEKLFRAFQDAFRAMDADKKSFKDNKDANDFLNEYFGDLHLFSNGVASNDAEQEIQGNFKTFLESNRQVLEVAFKQWGLTDGDFSYSDLMSGIQDKKYNTSPKFQKKIKDVAQYVAYYMRQPDFVNSLPNAQTNLPDFEKVEKGFDDDQIDPLKLDYFKRNHRDLLDTLNKKSKIYSVFKTYDKGKISKLLDEATQKVDYGNRESDDYVPPKRDDELTPWQQLSKNIGDTWSDYMDKYIKFRGDRLYMSNSAKAIVKALDDKKVKMKPTDGLGKLVENTDAIKANLLYKSPTATKHFEWMAKTLKELQSTMPKAFAGALQNGRQMRALVSELIMTAVRDGKMDEAKTAMEVLSVIKYGYTTSKIMDALGKENLSIFSDKGLSWNKNEGVQFVTNAMDKSIKAAFMGIGYGITIAGNAYNLHGSKFNRATGRMKQAHDDFIRANDDAKNKKIAERNIENPLAQQRIQAEQNVMAQTGITDATYAQHEQAYNTAKSDAKQKLTVMNDADKRLKDANQKLESYDDLTQQINSANQALPQIQQNLQQLQNALNNPNTYNGMPPQAANALAVDIQRQITDLQQQERDIQQSLPQLQQQQQQLLANPDIQSALASRPQYQADFNAAQTSYNTAQQMADQLGDPVHKFKNAKNRVDELNRQIDARNDEINNWDDKHKDKFQELMAYWDFLETGRNTHTGNMYSWTPGSAAKKQKKFNGSARFQQYLAAYGRVA
mgnify:FL=1